jgi:hypothetical protein
MISAGLVLDGRCDERARGSQLSKKELGDPSGCESVGSSKICETQVGHDGGPIGYNATQQAAKSAAPVQRLVLAAACG